MQQQPAHFPSNEFSRRAAEIAGGLPHFIHAPNLPDPEALDFGAPDLSARMAWLHAV